MIENRILVEMVFLKFNIKFSKLIDKINPLVFRGRKNESNQSELNNPKLNQSKPKLIYIYLNHSVIVFNNLKIQFGLVLN